MEEPSVQTEPEPTLSPDAIRLLSDWNLGRIEAGPPLSPKTAYEVLVHFEKLGDLRSATLAGLKGLLHSSGAHRKGLTSKLKRLAHKQVHGFAEALRNQGRADSLSGYLRNPEQTSTFSPYAISLLGELGDGAALADLDVIKARCMEPKKQAQAAAAMDAIRKRS